MNARWVLACLTLLLPAFAAAGERETAAEKSAVAWLAVLDRGDYRAAWDGAANVFRSAVTPEDWAAAAASVRQPLGSVMERKLLSAQYARSLPGVPDGEYVVLQFQTRFAQRAGAVETVTPALEDGVWKVSGYYVR